MAYHAKPKLSSIKCIPIAMFRFRTHSDRVEFVISKESHLKKKLVDALLAVEFVMLHRLPFDKKSLCVRFVCVRVWEMKTTKKKTHNSSIENCSRSSPYIGIRLKNQQAYCLIWTNVVNKILVLSSTLYDRFITTAEYCSQFICYQKPITYKFRAKNSLYGTYYANVWHHFCYWFYSIRFNWRWLGVRNEKTNSAATTILSEERKKHRIAN